MAFLYAYDDFILRCHRASGRNHVLKTFGAALLLASGLAIIAGPALALQTVVTQTDKNPDGSVTYHFALKTDPGETLTPGDSKAAADFVTVYNFYGLVDGSAKVPAGWEFSSETSGRTPAMGGYPLVLPLDVPDTPYLDGDQAGRRRDANRRLHRDHPRQRNGARAAPGGDHRASLHLRVLGEATG